MKSSSVRILSSSFALCLAAVAVLTVACSSSDSNPTTPLDTGDAASDATSNGAGGNTGGSTSADSGSSDSGSSQGSSNDGSSDSGPLVCPSIMGSYVATSGGGDSSSECPAASSDTCVFTTDTTTCQLTAVCEKSGDSFMATLDSTGTATYMRSASGISANCTLKFSSDHSSFSGDCTVPSFGVTCDASGELTD